MNAVAPGERRFELGISRLLRNGVRVASVLAIVGGVLNLIRHAGDAVSFGTFTGGSPELSSLGGIVDGALHLRSAALLQLGLVCLIATPIARVGYMLIGFIGKRDTAYIVISTVVFLILLYGMFFAAA